MRSDALSDLQVGVPRPERTRPVPAAVLPASAEGIRERWERPVIRRATQLVSDLDRHTVDLIEQYTRQLPLRAVLDIVGVPAKDQASVAGWFGDSAGLIGVPPEFRDYCHELVAGRAAAPATGGSVLDRLQRNHDGNDGPVDRGQIAALLLGVTQAAWIPAAAAIRDVMDHSLADPARWARIGSDEHYRTGCVEASLYRGPAGDIALDGTGIPAGGRRLARLVVTIGLRVLAQSRPHLPATSRIHRDRPATMGSSRP